MIRAVLQPLFQPQYCWCSSADGSSSPKVGEISRRISVDSGRLHTQKGCFMVPFLSPYGMPCASVTLIAWFWQLLTDQIPSVTKKHPTPGAWSPSKLTLHLFSLLLVLLLPASPPLYPVLFISCVGTLALSTRKM